jgi:hypothetical protein
VTFSLLQTEFFMDDDGKSLFEEAANHPTLRPVPKSSSQLCSHELYSTPSVATVIFCGVWTMSVLQLCDVVQQHRSLRQAKILSTECYTESTRGVVHRFLVLELHREGRKDICLRIDRRPSGSILRLLRTAGNSPAKDTVCSNTHIHGRYSTILTDTSPRAGPAGCHEARSYRTCDT